MAEQDTDNTAIENDDAAFEARIISQYIRDLSFESPSIDRALEGPRKNPNLELEVNVNARSMRDSMFQSEIEFKAHAVDDGGTIYQLEATYGGVFQVGPLPREALEPFLLVNCPSMLFPFLRRLVADLTREGGFPPLFLDPIDFGALYVNRRQLLESQPPGGDNPMN
jgi:preprotein translocase subunit SecB